MNDKSIEIIESAMLNEWYLDDLMNEKLNSKKELGFYFMHPAKIIEKCKKQPSLRVVLFFILKLWKFIAFAVIIMQLLNTIRMYLTTSRRSIDNNKKVFLSFSGGLLSYMKKNNFGNSSSVLYLKDALKLPGADNYSIFSILTFNDIFRAFRYAILYHFKTCGKERNYHALFSYFAFEWFLVYFTLRNVRLKSIVFGNHYDRWAILFDNLGTNHVALIQHGILNKEVIPPTKLYNIINLKCYSKEQEEIFLSNIISGVPQVEYFKPLIELVELETSSRIKILFISCLPLTFNLEMELIKLLELSNFTGYIYIKPHPVYSDNDYFKIYKNRERIKIIEDVDLFPIADIVLSYQSTLAFDYLSQGQNVIYFDSYASLDDLASYILLKEKM